MSLLPVATAQTQVGTSFSNIESVGDFSAQGEFHGLRINQGDIQPSMQGFGQSVRLQTWNYTGQSAADVAFNQEPGGVDRTASNQWIGSNAARRHVDFLILPIPGFPTPTIAVALGKASIARASGDIVEPMYVGGGPEPISWNLEAALSLDLAGGDLNVSGTFAIAVWEWDLQVGNFQVQTGSHRSNVVLTPLGQEVRSDTMEQQARLTIEDGWLEIQNPNAFTLYGNHLRLLGEGTTELSDLVGTLSTSKGTDVNGATLLLKGKSDIEVARRGGTFVKILHADEGFLDGREINLIDQKPGGPLPGTTVTTPSKSKRWFLPLGSIVGLILVAALLHGPMQGVRFTRLQRRFEERDYIEVLSRIDPFTRRRRFRRRASFLKAISLLSLESYKEASLYIETLGPQGPDPATRSFLKACAAAGLGQDSVAIEHLTTCFALDPSYREEAATVPLLAALLPFFYLAEGASPA